MVYQIQIHIDFWMLAVAKGKDLTLIIFTRGQKDSFLSESILFLVPCVGGFCRLWFG